MTAIHIIDNHLELVNIGTNTHAQIDTFMAKTLDAVHVYRWHTSNVAVPNATTFLVDYDNDMMPFQDAIVEYNYGDMYSHAASERITIKKAGIYIVYGRFMFHGAVGGNYRAVQIFKNGGYYTNHYEAPSALSQYVAIELPMKLVANDYIDLRLYQDSGASLNSVWGWDNTGFWVTMLSGA